MIELTLSHAIDEITIKKNKHINECDLSYDETWTYERWKINDLAWQLKKKFGKDWWKIPLHLYCEIMVMSKHTISAHKSYR